MDRLLLATSNASKVEEIGEEFRELGVEVTSPAKEGFDLTRPETGKTYHENARIKAQEAFEKSGIPSLADDSGLEVDALNGDPGIRSARWGGKNTSSKEKNNLMLKKLEGLTPDERSARFVCAMVLFDESGERIVTRGTCEGRIAESPRGENGFGYDPIFEVAEADWKTFAELDPSVKEWISHRALALNEMISHMRDEDLISDSFPGVSQ